MRLYEGVSLAFGPVTDTGFYYDFCLDQPISEEDFPRIEAEMRKIVTADEQFERLEMPRSDALGLCEEMGQAFKVEHIETGLADEADRFPSTVKANSSTSAAARTFPARGTLAKRSSC